MWRHRRRLRANGREDGIGKTMSPEGASSARNRSGPDPRTSIRARGVYQPHHEAGHTSAPDHMLVAEVRFRLHPVGRPHTYGEETEAAGDERQALQDAGMPGAGAAGSPR